MSSILTGGSTLFGRICAGRSLSKARGVRATCDGHAVVSAVTPLAECTPRYDRYDQRPQCPREPDHRFASDKHGPCRNGVAPRCRPNHQPRTSCHPGVPDRRLRRACRPNAKRIWLVSAPNARASPHHEAMTSHTRTAVTGPLPPVTGALGTVQVRALAETRKG